MNAAFKELAAEIKTYQLVLRDPRTPLRAKVFLGMAVAYFLSPVDLIPDKVPVVGRLDDAIVVPGLVWLALKSVPKHVVEDCRRLARSNREPARLSS